MDHKTRRHNPFVYAAFRFAGGIVSRLRFRAKFTRNELKGKKGPMVIIANHEAALDFVNMVRATREKINIVASNSFYQTLPIRGLMDRVGIIPKQQFQTSPADMRAMKHVVDAGGILGIYPAGLMCEDGLSTPIPEATWRFLQWMNADVYVIRSTGTYFCTPKWSRIKRPGRTHIDAYRLFTKEELATLEVEQVRERAEAALVFDAYRENDELKFRYKRGDNIEGLENVLYRCPLCGSEFTMEVRDKSEIYCSECGYSERSDRCGMLTKSCEVGEEIRYVSDWSRMILNERIAELERGESIEMDSETEIYTVDTKRHKFVKTGEGRLLIDREHITLRGSIGGEEINIVLPVFCFPSLPFGPGRYIELQDGEKIYRCMLKNGRLAMKYINTIKALHAHGVEACSCCEHNV